MDDLEKEDKEEQFIDGETEWTKEKWSYDSLIIKQINTCITLLSKERASYRVKLGIEHGVIPDIREEVINSIETLYYLIFPYLEKKDIKEIGDYKKKIYTEQGKLLETDVRMGSMTGKIKDIEVMPIQHPAVWIFRLYQVEQYKEIFRILLMAYKTKQSRIRALEEE